MLICLVGLVMVIAIIAILRSVIVGISLMAKSGDDDGWHRRTKRMLAWNLLEPGITTPWVLYNIVVIHNHPPIERIIPSDWSRQSSLLGLWQTPGFGMMLIQYFWPMALLLIGLPALALLSSVSEYRLAGQRALMLGAGRIVLIILAFYTLGIAVLGGIALLFMSVGFIHVWTKEIKTPVDQSNLFSDRAQAIDVGEHGLRILPLTPTEKNHDSP